MEEKIINKIDNAVYELKVKTPHDPSVLKINPKDYAKLQTECSSFLHIPTAALETYMGLKIDVVLAQPEGVVEVS